MAKLTVYIPDNLLDQARSQHPTGNTSQLVQRGLECLVGGSALYAQRPADADALLATVRERLTPAAAEEYQCGYRAALASVDEHFWPLLDDLARRGFDLVRWARDWTDGMGKAAAGLIPGVASGFSPPEWWRPLARDLWSLVDPIGVDEFSGTRTQAFVRGYEAALRDAWNAVEHATKPIEDQAAQRPNTEALMSDALAANVRFSCGHLPEADRVSGETPMCPTCRRPGHVVGPAIP